jgi:RNA-directed DNA polymerase
MQRTQTLDNVSTKLERIAELAKRAPTMAIRTLAHHIDVEFLRVAYQRTRKDGAAGVDGQTAAAYETALEDNLQSLLDRFKSGTYRAPPVRRVHIPKSDGSTRPLGIPTFEDKVLQRAVAMVLNAVYEQDFLDCSYGFRPGRSAHQALETLWGGLMEMGGGWVVEVDIRRFFDSVDHSHLRAILEQRVRDGVIRRSIDKWLKAGVLEGDALSYPTAGTPQGGVISPLLANVYLHEVLDVWFEHEVKPRLAGKAFLVRYADDVAIAFAQETDARRVLDVLPKRFGKYGLTLHPEKTRLVDFRRPTDSGGKRGTFDLLGFTHHWGLSRKGNWVVQRKTSRSSFGRALMRISEWCRKSRHLAVAEQHQALVRKLRGHYSYFGIVGNGRALGRFFHETQRAWRKWLHRRSDNARMWWDRFKRLLVRYPLPLPRVVHRLAAKPMT